MILLAALAACRIEVGTPEAAVVATDEAPAGEVWIYTSAYQSVIDQLEPLIEARLPGVDAKFFQAGSEKVAQRVEAEWDAGSSPACLLMTSDPFWYADLKERGRIVPYLSPRVLHVDRDLVDRDGTWVASRISLMVMAVNADRVKDAPASFAALAEPAYEGRISMPDPMASGTAFTTLAFWLHDGGWDRIAALDANGMIAAGGNSSVLTRIETGEREIGVLLLENVLTAGRKGSPAKAVFPTDGAIAVPGPIALTAGCPNPVAAKAAYDVILSEDGQATMLAGDLYPAIGSATPEGAPALDAIAVAPWPDGFTEAVAHDRVATKDRWTKRLEAP